MNKTESGYAPAPGFLQFLMKQNPSFDQANLPFTYFINQYDPLLDSSNMQPTNWLQLAKDIASNYDNYDGFVVIHGLEISFVKNNHDLFVWEGTDTLAYTASALSFLLENLNKTVVITGSQIPMVEPYSDATNNLLGPHFLFLDIILRRNRRTHDRWPGPVDSRSHGVFCGQVTPWQPRAEI